MTVETTNEQATRHTSDQLIPDVVKTLMVDVASTVIVIGADLRPLWCSNPDGQLFGRPEKEWGSGVLTDIAHPSDRAWLKRKRQEIMSAPNMSVAGPIRVKNADGDGYSTLYLTATNHFDDPNVNGIVVTLTPAPPSSGPGREDVRRAHAAKRQETLLDEVRSQILESLSAISTSSAALALEETDHQTRGTHAAIIDSATESLGALLADIVDLSKVTTGTMELDSIVFAPAQLLGDVTAAFEPVCVQKNVDLDLNLDPDVPGKVRGDPARMGQVLHHLISNAMSATTSGSVRIDASAVEDMRIRFRISHASTAGAGGLDPLSLDRRGLSDAEVRLSIARQIVELMHGSFGYETSDRGTAIWFDVTFGHARRANDQPLDPEPAPQAPSTSAHVLVVDDSDVNRLLATSQLERLGHTVATAHSGDEAIEVLANGAFDLVLMDWHMPGTDGLEATRRWRANHDPDHRLPIITMTASAMAGDRERCLEAGASDYLSKPVSINDLDTMITRWTQAASADATNASTAPPPAVQPTEEDASHVQSRVSELILDLGDISVVRSIVEAFLGMVPQYRASAEDAFAKGDRATVRRCAHTLKSTALMLGTDELAEACIGLEAAAANDVSVDLAAPVTEFARSCHQAEVILRDLAEQLDANDIPAP